MFLEKRKKYQRRVVRVSGLEKETCVKKYQERLRGHWQKVRVNEIRGVGEEWEVFMEAGWHVQEIYVERKRWEAGRSETVLSGGRKK